MLFVTCKIYNIYENEQRSFYRGKNNFNNPDEMRVSLEKEGAVIVEDKIVNFKTLYWDPSQELL